MNTFTINKSGAGFIAVGRVVDSNTIVSFRIKKTRIGLLNNSILNYATKHNKKHGSQVHIIPERNDLEYIIENIVSKLGEKVVIHMPNWKKELYQKFVEVKRKEIECDSSDSEF